MEKNNLDVKETEHNKQLYLAFGLEPGAPSADIKRAYRNLSLRFHPDASKTQNTARRFRMVNRVYEQLLIKTRNETFTGLKEKKPENSDVFSLGKSLVSSADPITRKKAAIQLGLSGKRSSWVFLRKGLYDSNDDVVAACVKAAAVLGLAQGGAEIAGAYERANSKLRDVMLETARATKDGIFSVTIKAAITDSDARRRAIAYSLSVLSKP